jgi:molecular chaperone DnaK
LDLELSRLDYEEMIEPWLAKTLRCVDDALDDAGVHAQDIDYVVLVGGASRTPLVHRLLQERLGQPLHMEVNPDLCVAMGAAIQGALIAGVDAGPVLVDITPHTLGIQAVGDLAGFESSYVFSPIIERNTPLPVSRSEMFRTMVDGQSAARITVFQGEHEDVRYNEEVGEFLLDGLADVNAGNDIQVRFTLDLNGILTVSATERLTNLEQVIVIESAMERFRQSNRKEAQQRLRHLFGDDQQSADSGESDIEQQDLAEQEEADIPPELQPLVRQAREMLDRGQVLLSEASADDAADLKNLLDQLREAVANRSEADIKQHYAALDDLVFYLQDA